MAVSRPGSSHRLRRLVALSASISLLVLPGIAGPGPVAAKPTSILVTTAADAEFPVGGGCSLRAAILAANGAVSHGNCPAGTNEEDPDAIRFALGGGTPTIDLSTVLPTITQHVFIQGAGAATRVRLNYVGSPGLTVGLQLGASADGSGIANLAIEGFAEGILNQANSVSITGTVIGPGGSIGILNSGFGVTIGGTVGVTAGGACTGACNNIIGQSVAGMALSGSGTVLGNVIGLDAAGTAAPNGVGIRVDSGSWTIGGTAAAAANVVSGNGTDGILVQDCASCAIQGNRIGTTPGGTAVMPNSGSGIHLSSANGVAIGGTAAGAGNVIGGNFGSGIFVESSDTTTILGNWVGVSPSGSPIGNGSHGILIDGWTSGAQDNVVGTTAPGAANTISSNGGAGVRIYGDDAGDTRFNEVRGNSIFGNGGPGIELEVANEGIAAPSIADVRPPRGAVTGCEGCLVDLYSDNADEGRVYEGTAVVAGNSWELPGLFTGHHLTATLTDESGNTSAFGPAFVPATPFTDLADSGFQTEITWLYANGITTGCSPTLYCPTGAVTREQMASFLKRMFALPPTGTDFFSDDETSVHESDINRLAASGITSGCAPGKFCPRDQVLRDQMASFLARATGVTVGAGRDYFNDDDGNTHEPNIDRNAAAGLTTGCGSYAYCPSGNVTREQMAAFLRRILVPLTPPPFPAP